MSAGYSDVQNQPPGCTTHEGFKSWCLWLGMTACAAEGWQRLCNQPSVACFSYFFGVLVFQSMSITLLLGKDLVTSWHGLAPHCCLAAVWIVYVPRMWLYGPRSAATRLNDILTLPHLISSSVIAILISVGPDDWVPYHHRPLSMIFLSVMLAFQNVAANSGSVPTLHPSQPHPTMLVPYWHAVTDALRVMDVFSEAFTIRVLLLQACPSSAT